MLKEISIHNFAIIEALDLTFSEGFNVFTGETGAGKSIILDAVSIVLGDKADASFIREGTPRATIEAVFDYGNRRDEILHILEREELLPDEDAEELTLLREIRAGGRSVARINGYSVNQAVLQEVGSLLVDIHGQSEHLSLLKPATHIHLVDQFAGNRELLHSYRELYHAYNATDRKLKELQTNEDEALRQQDILTYQINEIEAAGLSEAEEQKLQRDRERLANSEKIGKLLFGALRNLEGSGDKMPGIMDRLSILDRDMTRLVALDDSLQPLSDSLVSAYDQVNDVLDSLQRYRGSMEFDPSRLDEIEERVMLINSLKRKYGGSVTAVLAFCERAKERLALITNADEECAALTEELERLRKQMSQIAAELSEKRRGAAELISQGVERELDDLRMPAAEFRVDIRHVESENGLPDESGICLAFNENGYDKIEFLIAPNPGEGLKPLAKVASGGETSRLMLALKNTLARVDTVPTMVFDEIDQGIGGRIGAVVGEKLWQLSRYHQVLCITHLPQLAAMYDEHFHVRKQIVEDRTRTVVQHLDKEQSLHEMAALLGADNAENCRAVKVMLSEAKKYKML